MSSAPVTHTVRRGENLAAIAKHYQKSVQELVDINHLRNPNQLEVGQTIYLDKSHANAVQVSFLDVLRYPIEGLKVKLLFDDLAKEVISDARGLLPMVSTQSITSKVEVMVQNARGEWGKVGETISGLGKQWFTLVSPALKFKLDLLSHDTKAAKPPMKPANDKSKPHEGKAAGMPIKKDHPAKLKKGPDHNTVVLEVDIPQDLIGYFKLYKDEPITEDDWKDEAGRLGCEAEVLMAIAKVESGGATAFWKLNKDGVTHVPKILFERHYFHRLTCENGALMNTAKHTYHGMGVKGCKSPYDDDPDISWPVMFRKAKLKGTTDAKMRDGIVEKTDVYSDSASAYLRLIKAYKNNPDAALKSASWGKFQIMGDNYKACGMPNIEVFMKTMCSGEKGQIKLLAGFIEKNPPLHKAVKDKDWSNIATNYNGPSYKVNQYDTLMENAYNELKKKEAV